MELATEQALYSGMEAERERREPPPGFPRLPLIPARRYTDPEFLALEQEYLWRRSWLYALHSDELPQPGSYRLWRRTGSPIRAPRGGSSADITVGPTTWGAISTRYASSAIFPASTNPAWGSRRSAAKCSATGSSSTRIPKLHLCWNHWGGCPRIGKTSTSAACATSTARVSKLLVTSRC